VFIYLYELWTDLILLFHFLVWSFPYLDLGNENEVYKLIAVITSVFTYCY